MRPDTLTRHAILLAFTVFVVLNVPGRMTAEGKAPVWFVSTDPAPERFAAQFAELPEAKLECGWPWPYWSRAGRKGWTKEGTTLFLYEPNRQTLWEHTCLLAIMTNVAVIIAGAVAFRLTLGWLRTCVAMHAERNGADGLPSASHERDQAGPSTCAQRPSGLEILGAIVFGIPGGIAVVILLVAAMGIFGEGGVRAALGFVAIAAVLFSAIAAACKTGGPTARSQ